MECSLRTGKSDVYQQPNVGLSLPALRCSIGAAPRVAVPCSLLSHSHHKTSRARVETESKKRWLGSGAPSESRKTHARVYFTGCVFLQFLDSISWVVFFLWFLDSVSWVVFFLFVLPCQQANAAGALGAPERRAVDGSPC